MSLYIPDVCLPQPARPQFLIEEYRMYWIFQSSQLISFVLGLPEVSPLVVSGCRLAVVANQLESANHLPDGEESETLGENNTTNYELCPVQAPDALDDGRRLLGGGLE
jgi:hypothetical protein